MNTMDFKLTLVTVSATFIMTKPLTWPDFSFPPINLYTIGPAYFEDTRINSPIATIPTYSLSYGHHLSSARDILASINSVRQHH